MDSDLILGCGRKVPYNVNNSLLEHIVYIKDKDISNIGKDYIKGDLTILSKVPMYTDIRYFLECDYTKRQALLYVLLMYNDKYFLLDTSNLGNKKSLLYGHINKLDVIVYGEEDKSILFENVLLRHLYDKLALDKDIVYSISFKGYLRLTIPNILESTHLGLVYKVNISRYSITSDIEEILKGSWYTKEEILKLYDNLDICSKLILNNVVIRGV